jgi:hypothetical protein
MKSSSAATVVLLQEPTAKWGIRHPGYRLIWPQEGGIKPRTLVGLRLDAKLKVEYRSDIGQNTMGDIMVLDITMDTGRKIRVVNVYDQLEKGRNTNVRPAWMANWNQIMKTRQLCVGTLTHIAPNGTRPVYVKGAQPSGKIGPKNT